MAENIKQLSNAFSLGGGLNINSNQPIDSRFKVQSLVELTYDWKNKNNGGEISKYEGLLTFVEAEGKTFRYRTGASYTSGETTIANWELVPVSADDINSLVEIPEVDIQSISVNGETVTPVDGNVNIIIPEVVHPEYELVAGDTNSVKLLKDGEAAGEVSISLTADVVTTTEENTEKVTALSLATEQNIGKIILVKTAEGDYLAGTYIIDGIGSVKYVATTTGTVDDGDVDAKISSAIDSLDSSITAESGFLTGVTIENGKLVSYTSATVPEAPTYTAGDNISIEDNVISALGYMYDAEKNSFSVGSGNATGQNSYAEGQNTTAYGTGSHAEGYSNIKQLTEYNWDLDSTSIGFNSAQSFNVGAILKIENNGENLFVKVTAISEDKLTFTVDTPISLECNENSNLYSVKGIAYGDYSHAEGAGTVAYGNYSHAEGFGSTADGQSSHAEGQGTIASGKYSHAEGQSTTALGNGSHAEGFNTTASGSDSHAEGWKTIAAGIDSHAEGYGTTANNHHEHAQGRYNVSNKISDDFGDAGNTIHSIGIGTSEEARINAQEVMQNGDFYVINVGGYDGTNINGEGVKTLQEVIEDVTSDLGDYKVKDVIDTDKILAVDVDGKLSSTISLKHGQREEIVGGKTIIHPTIDLIGKDGETVIAYIDTDEFVKDGFLSSASYDESTNQLTLTWNTDSGIETPTVIDLTDLVHGLESESEATDLVKVEISNNSATKLENEPFKYIVSIDETNLENKLTKIEGAFIKSVVDNDTATYVKVNADTTDQVVTISVDESTLSNKITNIESRLDAIEDNTITEGNDSVENFVKLDVTTDTNNNVTITLNDAELKTKIDSIEGNFSNYVESVTATEEQSTLLKVEVNNDDEQNPVITLSDNGLNDKLQEFEDFIDSYDDADTKCTSATINVAEATTPVTDEVDVIASQTIVLTGETGESLETEQPIATVKVVTKQYVDSKFESITDTDTKCTSATINVAEATTPVTDEVDVIASQTIVLTGETGESLETEQPIASVKVVTKQYVDNKFAEVPTYTAITTGEIDALFA